MHSLPWRWVSQVTQKEYVEWKHLNTVALFKTLLLVYILCWAKPHIHSLHSYLADSGRYLHCQVISSLDAVHLKEKPPSGPFWVKVEVSFFALLWALWAHHPCPLSLSSSSIIWVYSSSPISPLGFSQSLHGNWLFLCIHWIPFIHILPHSQKRYTVCLQGKPSLCRNHTDFQAVFICMLVFVVTDSTFLPEVYTSFTTL